MTYPQLKWDVVKWMSVLDFKEMRQEFAFLRRSHTKYPYVWIIYSVTLVLFSFMLRCFCWRQIISFQQRKETKYRTCGKKKLANCPFMWSQYLQQTRKKAPRSPPSLTWTQLSAFNNSKDGGKKSQFPSSGWDLAWPLPNFLKIKWQLCYKSMVFWKWLNISNICPTNLWYNTAYIKNSTISHSLTTKHTVHSHAKPDAWLMLGSTLN